MDLEECDDGNNQTYKKLKWRIVRKKWIINLSIFCPCLFQNAFSYYDICNTNTCDKIIS